jgi:vesicle transport through interaction with t-SNAREs 1
VATDHIYQLGRADISISRASGTLKGMIRRYVWPFPFSHRATEPRLTNLLVRMYQQRVVTGAIIAVLILLILIIVYEKVFA